MSDDSDSIDVVPVLMIALVLWAVWAISCQGSSSHLRVHRLHHKVIDHHHIPFWFISQSNINQPPSPHGPPKHEDDNQQDQLNEYHINRLRAHANEERDEMARCFDESHEAHIRGDRAAAKDLSNQRKNHKQKMEQLNKEASNWIYLEKNCHSKPGEIDLHGLYVKEAIAYTDAALKEAKLQGDSEIRLIIGKGSHSEGGEAKVRPAIKGLMCQCSLVAEFDPSNSSVLVVKLI
ncbi:DUF1771-domain-containing protein [Armillaria gallica]|uniref:DUF1771-domain-containing protein n=1 Tax=Armillaria gallica TaxID=47427 RepID=A0A2H3CPW7_ARMGA|nr:DUF1771-domain-containing protein [Armillaria gallica]